MEPTVSRDKRGFTLIEVLISMFVLLVGLLGALIGAFAALDYNQNNLMRSEAIKIAQEQMENLRNARWGAPVLSVNAVDGFTDTTATVSRTVRKAPTNFTVTRRVATDTSNPYVLFLRVTVQWAFKDRVKSYNIESIRRQS